MNRAAAWGQGAYHRYGPAITEFIAGASGVNGAVVSPMSPLVAQIPTAVSRMTPVVQGIAHGIESGAYCAAKETTDLYRVVSRAELESVAKFGGFSPGPGAMGNKWFAESATDAAAWGKKFYGFDKEAVFTLRVEIPNALANQMMRVPKLDGIGPARSADGQLLQQINSRMNISAFTGNLLP